MSEKRMPLLILGKRQSGKTTALKTFCHRKDVVFISPSMAASKYNFKGSKIMSCDNYNKLIEKSEDTEWCIDEFSLCCNIPSKGQILALTDDINNFESILRKLQEIGYPVNILLTKEEV